LVYDERQHISVEVNDLDFTGRDVTLGSVSSVSVSRVVNAGEDGLELKLEPAGSIFVKASMFDLIADPRRLEAMVGSSLTKDNVAVVDLASGEKDAAETVGDNAGRALSTCSSVGRQSSNEGPDLHSGAVVLLIFELFGGRIPEEVGEPSDLQAKVSIGQSFGTNQCSAAAAIDPGSLNEKGKKNVENLANLGLKADQIAEALGEEADDVRRVMRRHGWNMEMSQKIPVLVKPGDLNQQSVIEVVLQDTKDKSFRTVAKGTMDLKKIVTSFNSRHSDILKCKYTGGDVDSPEVICELEVDVRMYALAPQDLHDR